MTLRVLPSTKANTTTTVNGRAYTATLGTPQDVLYADAIELAASGYIVVGGRRSVGSGVTASRPTTTKEGDAIFAGATYADTTLGYVITYDGATWRNSVTGVAV
jgi:hypothetical protein